MLTANLNQPVSFLKTHGTVIAGRGISVYRGSGGSVVSLLRPQTTGKFLYGKVVSNGPADEDDKKNSLYWVEGVYLKPTGDSTKPLDVQKATCFGDPQNADGSGDTYTRVLVSNLAEAGNNTHALAMGTIVYVWEEQEDDGAPDRSGGESQRSGPLGVLRWFCYATPQPFLARIESSDPWGHSCRRLAITGLARPPLLNTSLNSLGIIFATVTVVSGFVVGDVLGAVAGAADTLTQEIINTAISISFFMVFSELGLVDESRMRGLLLLCLLAISGCAAHVKPSLRTLHDHAQIRDYYLGVDVMFPL